MNEKPKDLFCLEGISCSAFNSDFTQCALSKKDSNIYIYETSNLLDTSTWKLLHTLSTHLQYISAIDWHPLTNRIISSSHDKNIIVWNYSADKTKWLPSEVVLKSKVGILDVSWNSRGDKFCAGTSSKYVVTGYYDVEAKWWSGKLMKEHKSSVTCVKFDPTSLFVISGSTDLKVIISSSYIPFIDDEFLTDQTKSLKADYGTIIMKVALSSWINAVNWSPTGLYAYAAGQDANVTVISLADSTTSTIYLPHSPIHMIVPAADAAFYGIGFDRHIYLYELDTFTNSWIIRSIVTKDSENKPAETAPPTTDNAPATLPSSGSVSISTEGAGGVAEVLKKLQNTSFQKKISLVVTSAVETHIHAANLSSAAITPDKETMITMDYAGFVKYWNI